MLIGDKLEGAVPGAIREIQERPGKVNLSVAV